MKFVFNRRLSRELQQEDPDFKADLLAHAQLAAENAKDVAPELTGDYKRSIHAEPFQGGGVIVVADDWKANFIEFGTVDTPAFAPLRRGVQNAGMKFRPR